MDVIAGWYPDPEDPANLRWWDGSSWTDHRQPAVPVTEAPAAEQPTEAVPPVVEPTVADTPAVDATATDTPAVDPTAVDTPTVGYAGFSGAVDTPPAPPPPQASDGTSRSRKPLFIGLGVIAVLAVAGAAFLFLGGDDGADYTWDGEDVAGLEETLTDADATFLADVEERNGSVTSDSRCYLVQSASEDAERSSDLLDFLRCGPVLFVDDDPDDGVWVTYALDAEENEDGDLVLTSADDPQDSTPSTFDPDEEKLSRPDGETPPDGDGGVDAPDVPAAEAGLVLSGDAALDDLELDPLFVRAVGRTKSVEVMGVGEPDRFGSGDAARRAADGERLVAFEIRLGPGDSELGSPSDQAAASASSSATVSIDVDGESTPIAAGDDEDYAYRHLVSVPEDAETVDVVIDDSDVVQRISLLTREPGPDNLQVLARTTRSVELGAVQSFPVTLSGAGGSGTDTFTVTVERARLVYYVTDVPGRVPSGPDKAFLLIHHFVTSDVSGITQEDAIALEAGHLHLDIGTGQLLEAINLAPDEGKILLAFEVPATFENGNLVIRGSAPSADVTVDLGDPSFHVPISIDGD